MRTKLLLLFFYTVVHGIFMFLAGVPFFRYKLTGAERARVHSEVLARREAIAEAEGAMDASAELLDAAEK